MKYIEQLLPINRKSELWKYLPFSLLFFGFMVLNYIVILISDISTNDIINTNIALYGKNLNFLLTIAPMSLLFICILLWVGAVHKQSLRTLTTSRSRIDFSRIFFSFTLWAFICITSFLISYALNPSEFEYNFKAGPFFSFLLIALCTIPLQTSFEEYFFRGYLLQGIGLFTHSRAVAFFSTSVIFGLLHLANPEVEHMGWTIMIYYIGTGLFLGAITLVDEGLELALGFHAANNLIGALLVTSNWTAFQTNSIFVDLSEQQIGFNWEFIFHVFVLLPIVFLIMAKKYKWSNYKQLLLGRVNKNSLNEQN